MNDKCGLVDPVNPSPLREETRGFIQPGTSIRTKLLFARARITTCAASFPRRTERSPSSTRSAHAFYREHPFYEAPDIVPALRRLIESDEFRRATDLP